MLPHPALTASLALLMAFGSGCTKKSREESQEAEALALIEKIQSLNTCETDDDCVDLGFVCGLGCNVPVSKAAYWAEKPAATYVNEIFERRPCDWKLEVSQCAPYYGLACDQGKCTRRSTPPANEECTELSFGAPDGRCVGEVVNGKCSYGYRPVECARVVRDYPEFNCRANCDGKSERGHTAGACNKATKRCASITYIRCSTCDSQQPEARDESP